MPSESDEIKKLNQKSQNPFITIFKWVESTIPLIFAVIASIGADYFTSFFNRPSFYRDNIGFIILGTGFIIWISFTIVKYLSDEGSDKESDPLNIIVGEHSTNLTLNIKQSDYDNQRKDSNLKETFGEINPIYSTNFNNIRERLLKEIRALNKRGTVNLTIGIVSALIGTVLVGYLAFNPQGDIKSIFSLVNHLPRLTLAAFAGILAFFFLQLYRSSLSEIKYYQNELTSLECKFFAFLAAIEQDDKEGIRKAWEVFANVERNFIIKKDETTLELERLRIDQQSSEKIIDAVTSALSTFKAKSES